MTTRKSFLVGAGLVIAIAGNVTASERSRGEGSEVAGESASAATPTNYRRLDTGTALVTINGQDVKVSADGSVRVQDAMEAYGSLDRMQFEAMQANVPSSVAPDGTRMYANGATGFFADLLGSNSPQPAPRSVEELKAVTPWTEQVVDGVTVVSFVNGAVIVDSSVSFSQPEWVRHRAEVANKVNENGIRSYADGAVFQEPLYQQQESQ